MYYNQVGNQRTDTLLDILEKSSFDKKDIVDLYTQYVGATYGYDPVFSQRTLSQLKNSGMMRLIRNHNISDSLNVYDSNIATLKAIFKTVDEQTTLMINTACTIFDSKYRRTPERWQDVLDGKTVPVLLRGDIYSLKVLSNYASVVQTVRTIQSTVLSDQKKFAARLMKMIQGEYHLE
jgi:hypothetical protein